RTLTRFIEYEYVTAQAAGRRAQNVLGAVACLAGGAQLHSRTNLEALGGRIDTSTLAEDTCTTFNTQLAGRKVVFEPNAVALAEEPERIIGLWKQRIRWARGNVHVTSAYQRVWFRPSPVHRLGGIAFGLIWFSIFLLPLTMIVSSASLVVLYFTDLATAQHVFRTLWLINALCFVFTTVFTLLIDPAAGRRTWLQGLFFPGAVSLLIIVYACFPVAFRWLLVHFEDLVHWHLTTGQRHGLMLFAYIWVAGCMLAAYLVKKVDDVGAHRTAAGLLYLVGYGPLLCAITLVAYVKQLRHAEMRWDKTEKSGRVAVTD
ncbi:MAG TPA: glycosyltransferase family 2 protein, partial [Acidimicrobiales bacterium]|nr:glycosyltransferase family 2 protein [Acidimicrobiales bacterium]